MSKEEWIVEIIEKSGGKWETVGDANNKKRAQEIEKSVVAKTTQVIASRVRRVT